jgi:hypothetical protein
MTLPLQILQVLADAAGHPLLKSVLRLQVESRVRPRPLKAVFQAELQGMQDRGLVMTKDNELDPDDPFYLLDEKGEAQAAKLRL